jgi:hypothetical protein
MKELDHIKFPLSLNELPQLLGFLDRLYDVIAVYKEYCKPPATDDNDVVRTNRRGSLSSPVLRALVVKTVDRSRENCHQHYYH